MIDRRDMSVILTMAMPPTPFEEPPKPARTMKEAVANLDRQADLLIEEIRGRIPFHDTLYCVIERMGG